MSEYENKGDICVKLTRKNCKKVLEILEMFGEPVYNGDKDRWSRGALYSGDKYATIDKFDDWRGFTAQQLTDWFPGKEVVKPRQLRNVLAKEYLKEGEIAVFKFCKALYIGEVEGVKFKSEFTSKKHVNILNPSEVRYDYAVFKNFIRYATDEEKALLEPKKVKSAEWTPGPNKGFAPEYPKNRIITKEVWVNVYPEFDVAFTDESHSKVIMIQKDRRIEGQTVKGTLTYQIEKK